MLARFNAWANQQIYGTCSLLSDKQYRLDRKAFFGSIHNTLNHLLVVDRLWLSRLEGTECGISSLDQILYAKFDALRAARTKEDNHLIDYVDALDETRISESTDYELMNGAPGNTPRDLILITLFNHQTHHRGQIHAMLTQAGQHPRDMDIIDYLDAVA